MAELGNEDNTNEPRAATLEDHLASEAFQARLSALLPKHLSTERFGAIAMTQLAKTPKLKLCTLASVLGGMIESAVLGLEIGTQGESWLVPYNVKREINGKWTKVFEAQLQIGVWGHMKLAHNTGRISGVQIDVVMEGDEWSFSKGTRGHLHHVPRQGRDLDDVDAIRWVYAVVATDKWEPVGDGKTEVMARGVFFDAFDAAWIERIRNRAQSYDSPAWTNFFAEQAQAKALKKVLKLCPKSRELARAITMTDELDAGVDGGQVWDVDTTTLLTAEVDADPTTTEARQSMRSMGANPGREPEPVAAQRAKPEQTEQPEQPKQAAKRGPEEGPGPDGEPPVSKLGW